jgi:WhiB family transcriptional regulator, redox-sensing transcriptional regulator
MVFVTQLPAQRAAPEQAEEQRDWWRSAACREADPELFFPVGAHGPGASELAEAKAVCAACRVRRQCLQYALATHQLHGVWGGTSEDERQARARREREQRDHRELRRPAGAEPGGNGSRGRGSRTRSV